MTATYAGQGIYTVPEVARLTGVAPQRIRRWLKGYSFKSDTGSRASPPVWTPQHEELEGVTALGFLDLNEVRFVAAFRHRGVSWKVLRKCVDAAKEFFQFAHPFALKRFRTDGRTIFAEVARDTGERELIDLTNNQLAFKKVLERSLYANLEFSEEEIVSRWWPLGPKRAVVVDPQRSFGKPIVGKEGVPTAVLYEAFCASKSVEDVADWHEVEPHAVKDAIDFERSFAA